MFEKCFAVKNIIHILVPKQTLEGTGYTAIYPQWPVLTNDYLFLVGVYKIAYAGLNIYFYHFFSFYLKR